MECTKTAEKNIDNLPCGASDKLDVKDIITETLEVTNTATINTLVVPNSITVNDIEVTDTATIDTLNVTNSINVKDTITETLQVTETASITTLSASTIESNSVKVKNSIDDSAEFFVKESPSRAASIRTSSTAFGLELETQGSSKYIKLASNEIRMANSPGEIVFDTSLANPSYRLKFPATVGTAGQVLTSGGGGVNPLAWTSPGGPGGPGTVSYVGMTVPSFLSVAGSPITTTGTLDITLSGTALPVLNGGTGTTTSTGTGSVVLSTSPTFTGIASFNSANITNNQPATSQSTGALQVNGGLSLTRQSWIQPNVTLTGNQNFIPGVKFARPIFTATSPATIQSSATVYIQGGPEYGANLSSLTEPPIAWSLLVDGATSLDVLTVTGVAGFSGALGVGGLSTFSGGMTSNGTSTFNGFLTHTTGRFSSLCSQFDVTSSSTANITALNSTINATQTLTLKAGSNVIIENLLGTSQMEVAGASSKLKFGFNDKVEVSTGLTRISSSTTLFDVGAASITATSPSMSFTSLASFNVTAAAASTITTGGGTMNLVSGGGVMNLGTGAGNMNLATGAGIMTASTGAGNMSLTTGTGNMSLNCGSGTMTLTNGAGLMALSVGIGGLTATAGAGAIALTTGGGAIELTTGLGVMSFTTGGGAISMGTLFGPVSIKAGGAGAFLGFGDLSLGAGLGNINIQSDSGAINVQASGGGLNMGGTAENVPLNGLAHFYVYTKTGGTTPETGNMLFVTDKDDGPLITGDGNITFDTTKAVTGTFSVFTKADIALRAKLNVKIISRDGADTGGVALRTDACNGANQQYDWRYPAAAGTTGQVLTSGGGTTAMTWSTVTAADSNNNISANNFFAGLGEITSLPFTMTAASPQTMIITGGTGIVYLPDATTLPRGATFYINNNSNTPNSIRGSGGTVDITQVPADGDVQFILITNTTAVGQWDYHTLAPSGTSWGSALLSTASNIKTTSTTQSTAIGVGSIVTEGGLSVARVSYFGSHLHLVGAGTGSSYVSIQVPGMVASTYNFILPNSSGTVGQVLTSGGGSSAMTWTTPGTGTGTVTSVAMTVPSFLSISGSPITTSGTLAVTLSGTALPVLNGGTGTTTSTGTGSTVLNTSPSFPASYNMSTGESATINFTASIIPAGIGYQAISTSRSFLVIDNNNTLAGAITTAGYQGGSFIIETDPTLPIFNWLARPENTAANRYSSITMSLGSTGTLSLTGTAPRLSLKSSVSGFVQIQAPSSAITDYLFILPTSAGTTGQLLTSAGVGNALTWTSTIPVANGGTGTTTSTGTGSTVLSASPTFTGVVISNSVTVTTQITIPTFLSTVGTGGQIRFTASPFPGGIGQLSNGTNNGGVMVFDQNNFVLGAQATPAAQGGSFIINDDPGQPVFSWYTRAYGAEKNPLNNPSMQLNLTGTLLLNGSAPSLLLKASSSGFLTIEAPATTSTYSIILPSSSGASGQVLTSAGSGNAWTWTNPAAVVSTSFSANYDIATGTVPAMTFTSSTIPAGIGYQNVNNLNLRSILVIDNNNTLAGASSGPGYQGGSFVIDTDPTLALFKWFCRPDGGAPNRGIPTMSLSATGVLSINGTTPQLSLKGANNAVAIQASTSTFNYTLTLPTTSGASGQLLTSAGVGNALTWTTVIPVANGGTGATTSTGTGSTVLNTSPLFAGTPTAPSMTLTNQFDFTTGGGSALYLTGFNLHPISLNSYYNGVNFGAMMILDCNNASAGYDQGSQGGSIVITDRGDQDLFQWWGRPAGALKTSAVKMALRANGDLLVNTIYPYSAGNLMKINYNETGGAKTSIRSGSTLDSPGGGVYINSQTTATEGGYVGGFTNIGHWQQNNCLFVGSNSEKYIAAGVGRQGIINVSATTSNKEMITFYDINTVTGVPLGFQGKIFINSGGGVTYQTTSDYRLKQNINNNFSVQSFFTALNPIQYKYIADPNQSMMYGFLAHEVQELYPYSVSGEKDAVDSYGKISPQSICHSSMVPIVAKGVKELFEIIDTQQSTIMTLQNTITDLLARVIALESL